MRRILGLALGSALLASIALAGPAGASSTHARTAIIDFSAIGSGNIMPFDYFVPQGVLFAPQQCYGSPSCHPWFVGWIQGDDAIGAGQYGGPIVARFAWPVSALSVAVAPAYQFKAKYVLTAFDAHGGVTARRTITESQDTGLPGLSPFGYFTMSLGDFSVPACRFSVRTYFVASSYPANRIADFGLSTIHVRFQDTNPANRCP